MSFRHALAGLALLAAPSLAFAEDSGLKPYQMVRSLELVQDGIAGGDHAALPMQRKLLEMTDARMRRMDEADLADPLNRRALLVYAMSGGNPSTVAVILSRMRVDDPDRKLGDAVLPYLRGQPLVAQSTLAPFDPMTYTPELGGYVALVKGSVLSADHPQQAIELLDKARLLSPGTLVEEAALRRSIALATTLSDAKRFMRSAHQYAVSYIQSPYASQFADAFVNGVVNLHAGLDLNQVAEIAAMMTPEQETVVYLRIARRAAIDGLADLAAFASEKAGAKDDPRAELYSSLISVTSESAEDMLATLGKIDRTRLSAKDRRLLDAVSAVTSGMAAPPAELGPKLADASPAEGLAIAADEPTMPEADTPAVQDSHAADAEEQHDAALAEPVAAPVQVAAEAEPAPDQTDLMMADARKKLADIDKMLGDTPK